MVTDSTAALEAVTAAAHGIVVVPMRVTVGGVVYRDDELPLEELIARFDEGVTTSGPSPQDFARALEGVPGEVLVLTVSRNMSGTYNAALVATADAGPRVRVLDTGTAAGGQALVALHAAATAGSGGTLDQVERAARHAAGRVGMVAAFETLDYLVRGGRLPGAVGGLASRLGVRPLIEVDRGGRIRRLRPVFSRQAAERRMLGLWRRSRVPGAWLHVVALHVLCEGEARRLLERVRAEVEPATALVARFGATMVAHTGPGLTGLSWWWEEGAAAPQA